jgi:hypothetical protein
MLIIKWTALIGATALFAASARAETITFGPALERAGWNVVSYPRIKPAIFHAENDTTLDVAADSAAGLLWHPVDATLRDARTAQWRWRVDEGVGPTDLTRRGRDDRALAVYFIFGAVDDLGKSAWVSAASSSFFARAMRRAAPGSRNASISAATTCARSIRPRTFCSPSPCPPILTIPADATGQG